MTQTDVLLGTPAREVEVELIHEHGEPLHGQRQEQQVFPTVLNDGLLASEEAARN